MKKYVKFEVSNNVYNDYTLSIVDKRGIVGERISGGKVGGGPVLKTFEVEVEKLLKLINEECYPKEDHQ